MDTRITYWAFGFPAATIVVVGADFVYAAGTLFIAKISLPHEQSLAGGLFQTMTQVCEHITEWPTYVDYFDVLPAGNIDGDHGNHCCI